MRLIIFMLGMGLCSATWATTSFWQDQSGAVENKLFNLDTTVTSTAKKSQKSSKIRVLHLDEMAFKQLLNTAPIEDHVVNNLHDQGEGLHIQLPLPDGDFATLYVEESSIMSPILAAKFPQIKTWKVWGDGKKVRSGRIDFTDKGFHAMLTMSNGDTTYIDPLSTQKKQLYKSISLQKANQANPKIPFTCQMAQLQGKQHHAHHDFLPKSLTKLIAASGTIQTYRLAVAATGAFTAQNGGNKASVLAAIVTVINRVNEIYQRDVAIKLMLVANNDAIIYTDANTDPYGTSSFSNLFINQTTLDTIIGSANYDIGHVFDFVSTTSAQGLAQVASVCDNMTKARASSGFRRDLNEFATNMVAHEIGHQFGATHSFSSNSNFCATGRVTASAFEPGSGTSIMSYAGICGSNNIQTNNNPFFHSGSIQQINQYVRAGKGASCAGNIASNNIEPVAEAGANYTIPANTPIELVGSAKDGNIGDILSYSWEQLDTSAIPSDVNVDNGDNAIFRIYNPVTSAIRTIPNLNNLYAGIRAKGDFPPQQSRLINPLTMALLVRDQNSGVAVDTTSLFVANTGRSFAITSHQTDTTAFRIGETTTVQWDVADTHLTPIACQNVDISLVIGDPNQGDTPVETLLARTANNGSAIVTLRSQIHTTQRARLKVKCSDNIFFALSPVNLAIQGVVDGFDTEADLSIDLDSPSTTNAASSGGGGGGSLNGFLFSLLLLLVVFKQWQQAKLAHTHRFHSES